MTQGRDAGNVRLASRNKAHEISKKCTFSNFYFDNGTVDGDGEARNDFAMENNTEPDSPFHMSLREAAKYLRVARRTLQHAIEDGELQAFRIGARRLTVRRRDLDAWLERFAAAPSQAETLARTGPERRSQ